jgi:hypothetical protein
VVPVLFFVHRVVTMTLPDDVLLALLESNQQRGKTKTVNIIHKKFDP